MENLKCGKDAYSHLVREDKDWNSEEVANNGRSRRTDTIFRTCEILAFLFLTCALLYCYASLWDLKYEVENLRMQYVVKTVAEEANAKRFTVETRQDELEPSNLDDVITSEVDDDYEDTTRNPFKWKREIAPWHEYTSERSEGSRESTVTSSRSYSSDEYSSETPASVETSSRKSRKRRKHLRKPKKYHRHGVSAEKFFTDLESTTVSPISIRQSRTKQTAGFELGKHKRVLEHKPLLQVYGSKDYITLEEALRRPGLLRNVKSEHDIGRRPKSGHAHQLDMSSSKELAESIAYNMVMVHYAGDTSHYSRERDSHYCGNGRVQMKESIYKDWKAAHSTQGVDINKYFSLHHGEVTVSVTGIYLIYAQVQYSNLQEVNGYELIRNRQPVVQCITTSVHPDKNEIKSNTCDTSTTILLSAGDRIYIQDLHHGRHVILTPEKSYFGLILLSPFKEHKKLR